MTLAVTVFVAAELAVATVQWPLLQEPEAAAPATSCNGNDDNENPSPSGDAKDGTAGRAAAEVREVKVVAGADADAAVQDAWHGQGPGH